MTKKRSDAPIEGRARAGKPIRMLCLYRPKTGKTEELLSLVKRHWPALHAEGLATDQPAIVYRASDKRTREPFIVEIFSWRDEQASATAHDTPAVRAIWGPMEAVLQKMDLAVLEEV